MGVTAVHWPELGVYFSTCDKKSVRTKDNYNFVVGSYGIKNGQSVVSTERENVSLEADDATGAAVLGHLGHQFPHVPVRVVALDGRQRSDAVVAAAHVQPLAQRGRTNSTAEKQNFKPFEQLFKHRVTN